MKLGLKQGYILSPPLFNLYINGLVTQMKRSGLVVEVDDLIMVLLLYANDLAIIADCDQGHQDILNALHE